VFHKIINATCIFNNINRYVFSATLVAVIGIYRKECKILICSFKM